MDNSNDRNCRMLVVSDDGERHVEQALGRLDVDVYHASTPLQEEHLRDSGDRLPHAIVLDVCQAEEENLRRLKGHARLGLVPVLVLLSDRAEGRVKALYAAGASLVFLKPDGLAKLQQALASLVSLWCEFVTPPPLPRPLA